MERWELAVCVTMYDVCVYVCVVFNISLEKESPVDEYDDRSTGVATAPLGRQRTS